MFDPSCLLCTTIVLHLLQHLVVFDHATITCYIFITIATRCIFICIVVIHIFFPTTSHCIFRCNQQLHLVLRQLLVAYLVTTTTTFDSHAYLVGITTTFSS